MHNLCTEEKNMEKLNPKNSEIALTYQLHDSTKVLYALGFVEDKEAFETQLQQIEGFIKFYRKNKNV